MTRTPITAGFTRSTMSANPAGRAALSAPTWATAVVDAKGRFCGTLPPPNKVGGPEAEDSGEKDEAARGENLARREVEWRFGLHGSLHLAKSR